MRIGKVQKMTGRATAVIMVAGLASGCSSDVLRFSESPFSNPYTARAADPAATGSARPLPPAAAAPLSEVRQQPLPPPAAAPRVASLSPPALPSRAEPVTGSTAGWTAAGGTPVTLQQGETVDTLSQRYGVPSSAILAVNGLKSAGQAAPGQQIIIPAYNAVSAGRPIVPVRAATPALAAARPGAATQDAKAATRTAALGQPLPPRSRRLADDEDETPPRRQAEPARPAVAARPAAPAAPKAVRTIDTSAQAARQPAVAARPVQAAPVAAAPAPPAPKVATRSEAPPAAAETTASVPAAEDRSADFRWPVRGRVISGFGSKSAGGGNDGINIAVPEGTPVMATEGGTVVHADDRLKGYGKLVLIKHDNGFVSAYAHNSDLMVKRGDRVRRGQVVAKSGATGNVTSPQLHFELRKGSTPVDPIRHLEN